MQSFQQEFIELALKSKALRFGEFVLKSKRVSPYFFNAGQFNSGRALALLGQCYATQIIDSKVEFDMLFGPAYKGIPLVAVTAAALATYHDRNVLYAFNRKEPKTHGEGGMIVGAPLAGKILIIDDVITAGTAIREAVHLLLSYDSVELAGVVIGLDRCEKGTGELSAVQSFEQDFNTPVQSIVTIEHLLEYLSNMRTADKSEISPAQLKKIESYWQTYGAIPVVNK